MLATRLLRSSYLEDRVSKTVKNVSRGGGVDRRGERLCLRDDAIKTTIIRPQKSTDLLAAKQVNLRRNSRQNVSVRVEIGQSVRRFEIQ